MEGFAGGFLGALQARNEELKAKVDERRLGIDLQELDMRRQQMQQKMVQENGERLEAMGAQIGKVIQSLGPQFQTGTGPDKMLDQWKGQYANWLKMTGQDPELAAVMAESFRQSARVPQRVQAAAGTNILQVQPDGSLKTVVAVPPNPPAVIQSAQFAAPNDPQRQRELVEGGMGGQTRFSGQTPVFDASGKQVAYATLNERTGAREYRDAMTGEPVQPKPDWSANTLSSQQGGQLSGKQIIDLQRETLEEGQGIDAMVKMVTEAQSADQGYKLVAQRFSGAFKTFFDQRKNDKEFQAAIQQGNLAGALGALRVPLLGPGVMTQQDKEFLVSAVGGDVTALRDPEVMAFHVGNLIQRKAQLYELNRDQLANQASRFPKLGIKVPDEKKIDPKIFERKAQSAEDRAGNAPARPAPTVGTVRNGYRFKGGDPGEQASWEKVN